MSQGAALAPLVVLAICLGLSLAEKDFDSVALHARSALAVVVGLIIGGALSWWIGHASPRVALATNFGSKLSYLWRLWVLVVLFPGTYPRILQFANVVLLIVFPILSLSRCYRDARFEGAAHGRWSALRLCGMWCIVVGGLLILPFAAALLAKENWPSLRVLYLGPLSLCGAWMISLQLLPRNRSTGGVALAWLAIIVLPNLAILHDYAGDQVRLFAQDRRIADQLTAAATEHGTRRAFVLAYPRRPITDWNPHALRTHHLESSLSNFQLDWSAEAFIRRFTNLAPIADPHVAALAVDRCGDRVGTRRFDVFYLPEANAVCLCPP
ncbi:MAG: hypothetical protein D6744_04335 [Planctomycetota bacterium]|nr:MAG: hypothetical protein D6744_04335 [Planctomycetota bacterium]